MEKDLDRIQKIIERMARNSFVIKGWAITLLTGLLAFGKREASVEWAALRLLPAATFWSLDAYYLSMERAFRKLYARVASKEDSSRTLAVRGDNWWHAMWSPAVFLVYLPVIVLVVFILLKGEPPKASEPNPNSAPSLGSPTKGAE